MIRTLAGLALASLVAGCGHAAIDPADEQIAADGMQAMEASSQSTDLGELVFQNVSVSDPLQAAEQIGGALMLLAPPCVSHDRDPTDPHAAAVTLADCSGPFGLVHVDGGELATFGPGEAGALHVAVYGAGLTVHELPVTFSADAEVTFPTPATRNVVWGGRWSRTNEVGELVDHTSDIQMTIDLATHCSTTSGSATTTVAGRQVDTSLAGYALCRDPRTGAAGCPTGTVSHTGRASGQTLTMRFDGSPTAHITGSRGSTFSVDLTCTPL
jgi:hypothetical protein